MNKTQLKQTLHNLLNENQETFIETLNQIFAEEWLNDQEEELLIINSYPSNWALILKDKITNEIGEKYTQSSKLS